MKRLKEILFERSAAGIEVLLQADGVARINLVILKKEKGMIMPVTMQENIDLKQAAAFVGNLPVCLVISGRGVLNKEITFRPEETDAGALAHALPNASVAEFAIQRSTPRRSSQLVAILRNNQLDEVLDDLHKAGITNIREIHAGPLLVQSLLPLISQAEDSIEASVYNLTVDTDGIVAVSASGGIGGTANIGGEAVPGILLLAFAAAFNFFTSALIGISNSPQATFIRNESLGKAEFNKIKWGALVGILVVLLINFLIFTNYYSKENRLSSQLAVSQSSSAHFQQVKVDLESKREFLGKHGLTGKSLASFYADRLAAALPASIRWSELNIHPLMKKDDLSDDYSFETGALLIGGSCEESSELNEWIKRIKRNSWVSEVKLLNYTQDNAHRSGSFTLRVMLR